MGLNLWSSGARWVSRASWAVGVRLALGAWDLAYYRRLIPLVVRMTTQIVGSINVGLSLRLCLSGLLSFDCYRVPTSIEWAHVQPTRFNCLVTSLVNSKIYTHFRANPIHSQIFAPRSSRQFLLPCQLSHLHCDKLTIRASWVWDKTQLHHTNMSSQH